jgi:hypothetical protein
MSSFLNLVSALPVGLFPYFLLPWQLMTEMWAVNAIIIPTIRCNLIQIILLANIKTFNIERMRGTHVGMLQDFINRILVETS